MSMVDDVKLVVRRATNDRTNPEDRPPELLPMFVRLVERALRADQRVNDGHIWNFEKTWTDADRASELAWAVWNEVRQRWPDDEPLRIGAMTRYAVEAAVADELWVDEIKPVPADFGLDRGRSKMLVRLGTKHLTAVQSASIGDAGVAPGRYASELCLLGQNGATALGEVLLNLTGRDAVRWLFACEVVGSIGDRDEWRTSIDNARYFLAHPHMQWDAGRDDDKGPPCTWSTIVRLTRLGLLEEIHIDEADIYGYNLTTLGREIFSQFTEGPPPGVLDLARALLTSTTAGVLRKLGDAGETAANDIIERELTLQARILTHEVRNKLVPIRNALDMAEDAEAPPEAKARALKNGREAVRELLRFAETAAKYAKALRGPEEWFDLDNAIADALVAGRNGAKSVNVAYTRVTPTAWSCHGRRASFVTAVTNIVRNAVQAVVAKDGRVEITWNTGRNGGVLSVEDDGAGIPEDKWQQVFDVGYSTKPAGTGMGLDFARSSITQELDGTIVCLRSSTLGGAKFDIALPLSRLRLAAKEPSR